MKIDTVAAQLYTIRDFTKTEADFAASMEKIAAIGRATHLVLAEEARRTYQSLTEADRSCCASRGHIRGSLEFFEYHIQHHKTTSPRMPLPKYLLLLLSGRHRSGLG